MSIWTDLLGTDFKQTFYDAKGIKTRVIEAGSGEPLVMLHGTGGHAEAYIKNIAAHAKHFRVLSVDMIGHGYTDAPDMTYTMQTFVDHLGDLANAIGAKKIAISGESLGGMVGAWYAIQNPDKVSKLSLVTGMLMERDEHGRQELADVLARSKRASAELTRDSVRARLEWLMHDKKNAVTDELVDIRHAIYVQAGRAKVIGAISAVIMGGLLDDAWTDKWSRGRHMAGIKCPTLVLWSRYNPGLKPERAKTGADFIPNHKFVVFEHSAHWPQWEEAELFNKVHLEFMRG